MKSEERKNGENTALWGGRFSQSLDQQVLNYSASLHFDSRLAPQDIRGSKAHAAMLSQVGILSAIELQQINGGFETIEAELAQGTFPFRPELEDIHMNIETRLTELIGDVGKKLHTGRSRNDQVALDLRLFCRDVADGWQLALSRLISAFIERAELTKETLFPASTHLQAAQPISWAHYFLAFAAMLMVPVGLVE